MRPTLLASVLLLVGCSHVTHGAYVNRGWTVGAEMGAIGARADATIQNELDLQLQAGYGWRWADKGAQALSLTFMVPVLPKQSVKLDLYLQLASGPVDFGMGAMLGVMPEAYFELGHRFGETAELSGGTRFGPTGEGGATYAVFALLTFAVFQRLQMGVWGQYQGVVWQAPPCDTSCDLYAGAVSGGVMITVRLGRIDRDSPEPGPY